MSVSGFGDESISEISMYQASPNKSKHKEAKKAIFIQKEVKGKEGKIHKVIKFNKKKVHKLPTELREKLRAISNSTPVPEKSSLSSSVQRESCVTPAPAKPLAVDWEYGEYSNSQVKKVCTQFKVKLLKIAYRWMKKHFKNAKPMRIYAGPLKRKIKLMLPNNHKKRSDNTILRKSPLIMSKSRNMRTPTVMTNPSMMGMRVSYQIKDHKKFFNKRSCKKDNIKQKIRELRTKSVCRSIEAPELRPALSHLRKTPLLT